MWKCSNCETSNEGNFCVTCGKSKAESALKQTETEGKGWKCSRCGFDAEGNFCSGCRMAKAENDAWQPTEEQPTQLLMDEQATQVPAEEQGTGAPAEEQGAGAPMDEQMTGVPAEEQATGAPVNEQVTGMPMGQQTTQFPQAEPGVSEQPVPEHKSGNKGVIIGVIIIGTIFALLLGLVFFAVRLIVDNAGDSGRDTEVFVVEYEYENDDEQYEYVEYIEYIEDDTYVEAIIDEEDNEWAELLELLEMLGNEEDRDGEDEWTTAQMDLWWDLMEEYWEISDPSLDLYFFIWDHVILDDTILEHYPNADVERLIELHTEFDDQFERMLSIHVNIDFELPFDSEHNREAFEEMRNVMAEHERFYNDFRAALEGR